MGLSAAIGQRRMRLLAAFLALSTGFPAPFSAGPAQVVITIALFVAMIALTVIALPGMAAARISPRAVLQE
jgi:uncharacterized membrane protein